MRLDALLNDLCQNGIKRPSTYPDIDAWLERAEKEHSDRPFRALLSHANPRDHNAVIIKDQPIHEGNNLWLIPECPPVHRTADELVRAVSPILRVCRQISFIDPYFDPNQQRFMDPMRLFLQEIWGQRHKLENPEISIHTGIDRFFYSYEVGLQRNRGEEEKVFLLPCHNMPSK